MRKHDYTIVESELNPYYIAFMKQNPDEITVCDEEWRSHFAYTQWVMSKHREYKKEIGMAPYELVSEKYHRDFEAWLTAQNG